jgi:hypothetical protein
VKEIPGKHVSRGFSDLAAIASVNNAGSWNWPEREVRRHLVFVDPCRQPGPPIGFD